MKVGFIGLGRMGQGMAGRIQGAGHELTVYDMFAGQAKTLAAAGAPVAASPGEVAERSEIVVTMLVEDAAIGAVALGPNGLVAKLAKGSIHFVLGTHGVAMVLELEAAHAAKGQTLVAAPGASSGLVSGAAARRLMGETKRDPAPLTLVLRGGVRSCHSKTRTRP